MEKEIKITDEEINKLMTELDDAGDMENTEKYALKQLLTANSSDISFKSELDENQINSIAKILTIHHIIKAQSVFIIDPKEGTRMMNDITPQLTENIMRLVVSKKRAGRAEFVDAFKGSNSQGKDQGTLRKFLGGGDY